MQRQGCQGDVVGNMVLYVICGLIGALTVAPYKYMWWVASLIFLIIVFMLLLQRLNNAEGYGGDALKGPTWHTILVWLVYLIVWHVGSEGTGALGLSQEVGIITIADLIAKIGFGFYLLANVDAPEAEIRKVERPFLRLGLQLALDGVSVEEIMHVLNWRIQKQVERESAQSGRHN